VRFKELRLEIKVNQKLRNTSSDSDKSTNDYNIGSEVANELDDAFHTGNAVQKRHKCVVDTFTKNTQMRHEHPS